MPILHDMDAILREELGRRNCFPEHIQPEDQLTSLGFDSSSVLRVISVMEEHYELDYEKMTDGLWTVADLLRLISSK
ncbi:hypothetical protein B9T26_01185 [Acinetobacter sp. ANC 4169]|jgi:acyl carrier protein|uniref:acyl carrier protein n=1 Tax=Acinetobacter sp. ANC 4169 TaxID=1977879 RepID=UPI000A353060|nr:acyl carrier protein [Acinetobacter sp. ANC 4169]OTG77224.1 hypothetical protein B9T26_01185 [Acinetobacter sp. ANC 4169]